VETPDSVGLGRLFALVPAEGKEMPTIETSCAADLQNTTALLQQIEQVIHWLSKHEPRRQDLVCGIAQMLSCLDTLSQSDIINLQLHVLRLRGGPLKTLLNRQVAELGALYGLDLRR
jgi:hypothetical protein